MIFFNICIILIAIGYIGLFLAINFDKWRNEAFALSSVAFCILGFVVLIRCVINRDINPTTIDVYRGRTTLEITYKDGVAVDTVVTFKERN